MRNTHRAIGRSALAALVLLGVGVGQVLAAASAEWKPAPVMAAARYAPIAILLSGTSANAGKVLVASQMACGFVSAVDGQVDKIMENTAAVKPTFMAAAPRIFEKAHGRIVTAQQGQGWLKERLFRQAFAVGREVDRRKRENKSVPLSMSLQHKLFG